jgi:hypothetical protein
MKVVCSNCKGGGKQNNSTSLVIVGNILGPSYWSFVVFHWWRTRVFNKSLVIVGIISGFLPWSLVMFLSFSSFVLLLQVILDQKHTQSDKGS